MVLRRLDAVLAENEPKVLNVAKATESMPGMLRHLRLAEAGHQFRNTSTFDFAAGMGAGHGLSTAVAGPPPPAVESSAAPTRC